MAQCYIRTEKYDDQPATWAEILQEIHTLDSPERGTSPRDNAFITMWFVDNGTDEEFMQCFPVYPKQLGLLKRLLGASGTGGASITDYIVELSTGKNICEKRVCGKELLIQVLHTYFHSHTLPDLSRWADTGIL